eukprot:TRINITY_DN15218_c0_g1_i1.p1 TRINITY_DN15218_c0_g1~~TRINITY_DN15218_c0_g1_i1.p1  ORF type:complete len:104 (-),score=3.62 TRINITY_DN15218_c0_g1_i1:91-402(-)
MWKKMGSKIGESRICIDISCLICAMFFGLILISGYWAISSGNSSSIEKTVLDQTSLNKTYLAVYWVGMGFFWIFFLFIVISDMHIGIPQSVYIKRAWDEVDDE